MGYTTTIVAVYLLAAVAEGYIGGFNNYGFRGFPQMNFPRLPQPPRLPLLPQFPFFGNQGFFNFPSIDVANAKPQPGGSYHGIAVSSNNNDKGGSAVIVANHNGVTETFYSDPQRGIIVASPPGIDRLIMQTFQFPEINIPKFQVPEFKMPEFPKIKPINLEEGPTVSKNFKAYGVSSSSQLSSVNGEPPIIVAKLSSITNDNGKIKSENYHFSNADKFEN